MGPAAAYGARVNKMWRVRRGPGTTAEIEWENER